MSCEQSILGLCGPSELADGNSAGGSGVLENGMGVHGSVRGGFHGRLFGRIRREAARRGECSGGRTPCPARCTRPDRTGGMGSVMGTRSGGTAVI